MCTVHQVPGPCAGGGESDDDHCVARVRQQAAQVVQHAATVTVGIDGSRESLAAADWAGDEALSRGRLLRLVHVRSDDADQVSHYADPETLRRSAEELLYTAAQHAHHGHPDVRLETSRLSGTPAEVLSTAAETAELLVGGGFSSLRLGSVGLGVAAGSSLPVTVVRGETERPETARQPCAARATPTG